MQSSINKLSTQQAVSACLCMYALNKRKINTYVLKFLHLL